MVFEAHLQHAGLLKKVVDAMKDLCKDVNFDCSEHGLQVQAMDTSHVALVSLRLREAAFREFKCDQPTSFGMNVDSLGKILKMFGVSDTLRLYWRSNTGMISFQCQSEVEDRITEFELKLMELDTERMEIPEQHYTVLAKLPSVDFMKICRDLKEFGETMQIKADKQGITFSVLGDMGIGNVILKPRDAVKPDESVVLTVREPVSATFALRYLVNFAKATPLCGAVELGLAPDSPLLVKFHLEKIDFGYLQFYLAPKIEE